ncbi:MAG: hypothetical protein LBH68_03060 [Bifidobacteriaceae bacterium]|jgi:hypothetical protein|nr:hypothetical protein [Bifidobacteriaceae bacterium]
MFSFPNDPLHDDLEQVARQLRLISFYVGEAANWIALADPREWVSPAATAYRDWAGDLHSQCNDLWERTRETIHYTDNQRSVLIKAAYG